MELKKKLLTLTEAANLRGVHRQTVKRWIKKGILKKQKIKNMLYVEREELVKIPLHINSKQFIEQKPKVEEIKITEAEVVPADLGTKGQKKKLTFEQMVAEAFQVTTFKERLDLVFKLLLLLPSTLIAYWIGSQSVGLISGQPSVVAGIIWMGIIAILNLSFFFLDARGLVRWVRIFLILITSLIGVSVIDSIVFAQTIETLKRKNIYSLDGVQQLETNVAHRQAVLDSATVLFSKEIIGSNGQPGGFGPIAQRLKENIVRDSLSLVQAKADLEKRIAFETAIIEQKKNHRDWFEDLSILYENTFRSGAKIIVFLLIFACVVILEILPLLFFIQHRKKK